MTTLKPFLIFIPSLLFLIAILGGVTAALNSITCRFMVIGMDSDLLYPLHEQEEVRTAFLVLLIFRFFSSPWLAFRPHAFLPLFRILLSHFPLLKPPHALYPALSCTPHYPLHF